MIWFLIGYSLLFIIAWMLITSLRTKLREVERQRDSLFEGMYGVEYAKRFDEPSEEEKS